MGTIAPLRHRGEQGSINGLEDLDQAIKVVGLCDVRLDQIDAELDVEVKRLKARALEQAAEVKRDREETLAQIELFLTKNRDAVLEGKKTRSMNFGSVGYRKSPSKISLPPKGSDEMEALCLRIEDLQGSGEAWDRVKIRLQKFILTGDVKHLSDEQLGEIELERNVGGDVFFVQPDREKLAQVEVQRGLAG